jgi:hypothetical protein
MPHCTQQLVGCKCNVEHDCMNPQAKPRNDGSVRPCVRMHTSIHSSCTCMRSATQAYLHGVDNTISTWKCSIAMRTTLKFRLQGYVSSGFHHRVQVYADNASKLMTTSKPQVRYVGSATEYHATSTCRHTALACVNVH